MTVWHSRRSSAASAVQNKIQGNMISITNDINTLVEDLVSGASTMAKVAGMAARTPGILDDSVGLDGLTYAGGQQPLLFDQRPSRFSEWHATTNALTTDPVAPLAATLGGDCVCRKAWELFCNETAAARAAPPGHECMPCNRACEIIFGRRLTRYLDPVAAVAALKSPIAPMWWFGRGDGNYGVLRDWGAVWVPPPTDTMSLAALNVTIAQLYKSGNKFESLVYPRALTGDASPAWTAPFVDAVTQMPAVACGVPAFGVDGEYVGGAYTGVYMAASISYFNRLANTSEANLIMVVTTDNGDIFAGSMDGIDKIIGGGGCSSSEVCSIAGVAGGVLLPMLNRTDAGDSLGIMRDWIQITVADEVYAVFSQELSSINWRVFFFVLKEVIFPTPKDDSATLRLVLVIALPVVFAIMLTIGGLTLFISARSHQRIKELESQLGSVAQVKLLGTPSEDVVRSLMRIKDKRKLSRPDREEIIRIVALIASNKLYRIDSTAKAAIAQLGLEGGAGEFLVDMLVRGNDDSASKTGSELVGCEALQDASDAGSEMGVPVGDSTRFQKVLVMFDSSTQLLLEMITDAPSSIDSTQVTIKLSGYTTPVGFDSWLFDVEELKNVDACSEELGQCQQVVASGNSQASLLELAAMIALDRHDLINSLGLPRRKVVTFVRTISRGYNINNQYHNALHAADVVQAVSALIASCDKVVFSKIEKLSLIVGALVHDFGHGGLNANFLKASQDPLFYKYNGVSILENMHAAESMRLLFLEDWCNFATKKLSNEDANELHNTVVDLVLATDMTRHIEIVSQYSTLMTSGGFTGTKPQRLMLMKMFIKFADISNPTRPWGAAYRWAQRVMEEFYCQGDRERASRMPVSKFMDRSQSDSAGCQESFIKFIVQPMAEHIAPVVPGIASDIMTNLKANENMWKGTKKSCDF
eukprot:m51a1_g4155 putative 3 -cyclic-nucleotide phosphodiesterase rega (927) ;mRNA; r:253082-255974